MPYFALPAFMGEVVKMYSHPKSLKLVLNKNFYKYFMDFLRQWNYEQLKLNFSSENLSL